MDSLCFVFIANPVAHVSQAFRKHLLLEALSAIVLPTSHSDNSLVDALSHLHQLSECASASDTDTPQETRSTSTNMAAPVSGGDEEAKWWTAVSMVAVHWLQGEDEAAEKFFSTVESVPKILWNAA